MSSLFKKIVIAVVVLAVAAALAGLYYAFTPETEIIEDGVARINLSGPIQTMGSPFADMIITPSRVEEKLQRAEETRGIEAVVMHVDSPGGSVAASQEIYDMIDDYDMPVVMTMGDMAASGGYYISAPADAIIARPGSMTGSIGVIFTLYDPDELLDNIGIEREIIKSGEHKDMFSRSPEEDEREIIQNMSDTAYDQFIQAIVEGRDMDEEEVRELATGEIYMGSQAKDLGLVDELGGYSKALELAGEMAELDDPTYHELPEPPLFRQLFSLSAEAVNYIRYSQIDYELKMLERLESGLSPALKYKVPGY